MKKSIPFICILLMPTYVLAAAKEPAPAAIGAKPPAQMSLLYPRIGR